MRCRLGDVRALLVLTFLTRIRLRLEKRQLHSVGRFAVASSAEVGSLDDIEEASQSVPSRLSLDESVTPFVDAVRSPAIVRDVATWRATLRCQWWMQVQ